MTWLDIARRGATVVLAAGALGVLFGSQASAAQGASTVTTRLVKDIDPGSGSSFPDGFTRFHRSLYFAADDGTHGDELWKAHRRRAHVR